MKGNAAKVAIAAVMTAVAAVLVLRGLDWRAWVAQGMDEIGRAGPWVFFTAMALLPAAAVPMLAFSLTAGSAFGRQMGMGWVVAAGLAAVTVNLVFTYWLARWALRPWLSRLVARLGYRFPCVDGADMTDLIILLRVTPGIPFFAQNYLLGLADAPPARYLAISCAASWTYTAAFILFGEALLHGRGRAALLALSLILALGAAGHLLHRHLGRRAGAAAR
jgi:uncharacterized membrane protein YdjX (TVP38/TMEM64 family)